MVSRRQVLRIAPLAVGAGCVAPTATEPFEGRYSWGFEESAFAPCGREERWWVVDDSALVARHRELVDAYEPVFARVYGELSARGRYGQGGQYPRELRVTRVVTVRKARADDCRSGAFDGWTDDADG